MRKLITFVLIAILLAGCGPSGGTPTPTQAAPTDAPPTATVTAAPAASPTPPPPSATATAQPTASQAPSATPEPSNTAPPPPTIAPSATAAPAEPTTAPGGGPAALEHILLIVFENHNYSEVIGQEQLTHFNQLARENVLFTRYFAVAHPSLPNYLALSGGSTFGIHSDCMTCFINAPNLADRLEAAGKTWKSYQEDMPSPCSLANTDQYDLNHNPWLYYDSIRTKAGRCSQNVVPLSQLDEDLHSNQLPNFAQIMPNLCNSAHNCALSQADAWLGKIITLLQTSSALGQNYAIFIIFDEASSSNSGCCGLPQSAGGRVPAILISPLAQRAFQDDTPLSHYSLLKTILQAWNLPGLGNTENSQTPLISAPWK